MFMIPTMVNGSGVNQPLNGFIFEGTLSSSLDAFPTECVNVGISLIKPISLLM